MNKKTRKLFTWCVVVAMLVTQMLFTNVAFAATKISGTDRYQTALQIVKAGWTKNENAVIARGDDLADALAAAPLAYAKGKAPILLTETGALPAGVLDELTALGVKNVYIVGGTGAVSQAVQDALAAKFTVKRLAGADRNATSLAVAQEAFPTAPAKAVIANGYAYADALSVSAIAANLGMPILLVDKDSVSPAISAYLAGKTVYAVGGTGVISDAVAGNATRLAGADRFATNAAILSQFTLDYSKVYVAKGTDENMVDALAGSALAALTNSPIVLCDENSSVTAANTVLKANLKTTSDVTPLGGTVSDSVVNTIMAIISVTPGGPVAVSSVKATAANVITVTLSAAPADTSKVVFTVKRDTTPVTVTATWNSDKTVATLKGSSNFPQGNYTVNVKNDTTDLGNSTLTVDQEKIGKLTVTSDTLAVVNDTTGPTTKQYGYATYKVLDQYGNDITTTALANSLVFQTGVGDATATKGLLTITPDANINLLQFGQVIITGYDQNSGVSTSATLKVSTALGTLSDMQITAITNSDGKVLTANDSTTKFYLDYTAKDMSGNVTKDLSLVKNGLILSKDNLTGAKDALTVSSSYVNAILTTDPNDSSKAAIQVSVDPSCTSIAMDLPITISAMTYRGTVSTLNVTLKKQSAVNTFTLMAPSYDIAVGETKEIPFVAYDQDGTQLTKYDDLSSVKLSGLGPDGDLVENVDGTAKLVVGKYANEGPQVVTAMTDTGKYSTLTLNIQKAAKASELLVSSSVLKTYMQKGASQAIDFGYSYGGLTVKDQYGREMDMTGKPGTYEVDVTTSGAVNASGTAAGGDAITVSTNAIGSGSVTFQLIDTADGKTPHVVIDQKTLSFSVVKDTDIVGYKIGTPSDIWAHVTDTLTQGVYNANAQKGINKEYKASVSLYGTLKGGSLVKLAPTFGAGTLTVKDMFISDTTNTYFVATPANAAGYSKTTSTYVYANKIADATKTGASTVLTVVVNGTDSKTHVLTTTVNSKKDDPVASSITFYADPTCPGLSTDGDTVYVSKDPVDYTGNGAEALGGIGANALTNFDSATLNAYTNSPVYFYAEDQYGTWGAPVSQVYVESYSSTTATFDVNADMALTTTGTVSANDYVVLTAVTNNGLSKTIKIVFE